MFYLDGHCYNTEGQIMEEIPAEGCAYVYLVRDFNFSQVPNYEQLLVVLYYVRTLCIAGIKECTVGR